ncbi:MAG: hypothetical protein JMDDDDMK_01511 [Acidobacteria bacterium]|nr:hypothetical protein [Acidobacteriota bacterium]
MLLSIQALLAGLIDYAGLFPPAALDMASAVSRYASYRKGETNWMLGRFIAPVARLDEFEKVAADHLRQDGAPWLLSALGGGDLKSDLEKVAEFNERNSGRAVIDTIEIKAERAADIEHAMEMMPATLTPYFEISIAHDPGDLIKLISALGARAKVRTGGVTAESFPSSLKLASFIKVCADEDAPFKATAGLHHPLRSVNRLTYEPDSESALMHGFLNVFLAAAFAQSGMSVERLVELLEERSHEAFQFDNGSVTWRGEMIVRGQLRNARSLLAIAFGSCSFEEPIEDLKKIGLL